MLSILEIIAKKPPAAHQQQPTTPPSPSPKSTRKASEPLDLSARQPSEPLDLSVSGSKKARLNDAPGVYAEAASRTISSSCNQNLTAIAGPSTSREGIEDPDIQILFHATHSSNRTAAEGNELQEFKEKIKSLSIEIRRTGKQITRNTISNCAFSTLFKMIKESNPNLYESMVYILSDEVAKLKLNHPEKIGNFALNPQTLLLKFSRNNNLSAELQKKLIENIVHTSNITKFINRDIFDECINAISSLPINERANQLINLSSLSLRGKFDDRSHFVNMICDSLVHVKEKDRALILRNIRFSYTKNNSSHMFQHRIHALEKILSTYNLIPSNERSGAYDNIVSKILQTSIQLKEDWKTIQRDILYNTNTRANWDKSNNV